MKNVLLIILISAVALVSIWFRNGHIIGGGEAGLPFYDLNRQVESSGSTWLESGLGNSVGIGVAAFPTYWVLAQAQNLGIPLFIIQAFFFWSLLVISGISIYFLIKTLFTDIEPLFILLGVFFYWFNPISLVDVWNRSLENFRVFWVLLPLALLLFILGLKKQRYYFALLIAFATSFFSYGLTSVPFIILLIAMFFYTSVFYMVTEKTKGKRFFNIAFLFSTLICFVLINFWWISQFFGFLLSSGFTASSGKFNLLQDNLSTLTAESQMLGQWSYIIRLLHSVFFNQGPDWARLYSSLPLVVLGFVVPILIFGTFIKYRKIKGLLFFGILWLGTLFLMRGNLSPFGGIFEYFFKNFFFLQVFRNPFEKFGFILALSATPILSFGLWRISKLKINRHMKEITLIIGFIFIVIFWGFPFWTGLVFTRVDESNKLVNYEVSVPDYYKQVDKWINSQGENFRFVSLPIGGEGMTYTWEVPYAGVELSNTLFSVPNISFNTVIPYFSELSSHLSDYQLDKRILDFLPFINGRFIVLRDDINYQVRQVANPKDIGDRMNKWIEEGLLAQRYKAGKLTVYETNKDNIWPKIFISPQIIESDLTDFSHFKNLVEDFPHNPTAVLKSDNRIAKTNSDLLIEPYEILSKNDSPSKLIFPLSLNNNDYSVAYHFSILAPADYYLIINNEVVNTRWFVDGRLVSLSKEQDVYKFFFKSGIHELMMVGKEEDFLKPIANTDSFSVNNSRVFKQLVNLPGYPDKYQLSFSYKFTGGDIFSGNQGFNVIFKENIDQETSPIFGGRINQDNFRNDWQNASGIISTKGGAVSADLQIAPAKNYLCNTDLFVNKNCFWKDNNVSVDIKNLSLKRIQETKPLLLSSPFFTKKISKSLLTWKKINTVKYQVDISKVDSTQEILVFSELFDSGWKMYQNNKLINDDRHLLVNTYANGWLFDKPGNYSFTLEYGSQRFLYFGGMISVLCFVTGSLYLGIRLRRR